MLRPKVLSFTTVFPRTGDEQHGLFVRARLVAAARLADIEVMAPVAVVEYGNPGRRVPPLTLIPEQRMDSGLRIHHPRWFYPPLAKPEAPWWLHQCTRTAVRAVRTLFPFELIDAHWGHPEGGAAARLARESNVPFTVTLRGNEPEHAQDAGRRRAITAALRGAARVIAVSQPLAGFATSLGVQDRRVCVIPNGVDAGVFHPRDRDAARARLGMEAGALHLLSAGHLIELKGHHRLIEAAAQLRAEGVDARVWIAGGPGRHGGFASAIHATAARTGMTPWVRFLGLLPPEEMAAAMSACDFFCLASSREGWPNAVNEALACGAPVVASRVGAVPEMLGPEGMGIIVESNAPEALAAGLRQASARQWDRAAIARHGQLRGWDQTAAEVVAAWRAAIEEGAR